MSESFHDKVEKKMKHLAHEVSQKHKGVSYKLVAGDKGWYYDIQGIGKSNKFFGSKDEAEKAAEALIAKSVK